MSSTGVPSMASSPATRSVRSWMASSRQTETRDARVDGVPVVVQRLVAARAHASDRRDLHARIVTARVVQGVPFCVRMLHISAKARALASGAAVALVVVLGV